MTGKKTKRILQFDLPQQARAGLSVTRLWQGLPDQDHDIYNPHRDKQYILQLITTGHCSFQLELELLHITAPALILLTPGQLHRLVEESGTDGLTIDFVPALIPAELHDRFTADPNYSGILTIPTDIHEEIAGIIHQMYRLYTNYALGQTLPAIHALLQALVQLLAAAISPLGNYPHNKKGRALQIMQDFRQLLRQHYKEWKRPADYATALAITVAHLNEAIRTQTGIPVSLYIQQQIIAEAQRLLGTSSRSVKEICYELGYDSTIYFSRLFKKVTGTTPLEFRAQIRD